MNTMITMKTMMAMAVSTKSIKCILTWNILWGILFVCAGTVGLIRDMPTLRGQSDAYVFGWVAGAFGLIVFGFGGWIAANIYAWSKLNKLRLAYETATANIIYGQGQEPVNLANKLPV